jgi:hypothetical protein
MVKQNPRIYVYKITFLEVLNYYYGVHKEDTFNEYYIGSPKTNKDFWEFYTPIKEIIKVFPFTDEGWLEANDFEDSLIEPVYNTDPLCLNKHCGGIISLDVLRRTGQRCYELGVGVHARTKEQRIEDGKKAGQKTYELGVGVHARTKEQRIEDGKKAGQKTYELGVGIHSLSKEERSENGKKSYQLGLAILSKEERSQTARKVGQKNYELGVGIHALTRKEKSECGKKGYEASLANLSKEEKIENCKKAAKLTNSQVWECTDTGFRSAPGPLTRYQKARGIDTSNRIRIQ